MPLSASRVDQSYKRLVEAEGSGAPPTTPSYGSSPAVPKFPSPSGRSPNEPPRLFDAIAAQPEPSDMHDYYSHCRGYAEVLDANARTLFLQRMMFAICTTQVVCACALTSLQDTTPDSTGKALVLISSVVSFLSGIIGFAGAWKKSTCVHAPRTTAWPRLSAHASSSSAPPLLLLLRAGTLPPPARVQDGAELVLHLAAVVYQRRAHTVSQGAAHPVERADLLLSKEASRRSSCPARRPTPAPSPPLALTH